MKKVVTWNSPTAAPTPKPRGRVRITNNDGIISTLIDHMKPGRMFVLACKLRSFDTPTAKHPVLAKAKSVVGGNVLLREGAPFKRGTIAVYAGETRITSEMKGRKVKMMAYLFIVNSALYAITDLTFVKPVEALTSDDTSIDSDD